MCFIGVEVKQKTSAPPPKKKSWIRPWVIIGNNPLPTPSLDNRAEMAHWHFIVGLCSD